MRRDCLLERMIATADCSVTLYSADGKNWSTNPGDLREYAKRRRQAIKVARELMNREFLSIDEN